VFFSASQQPSCVCFGGRLDAAVRWKRS